MVYIEHIKTPLGYLAATANDDALVSIALSETIENKGVTNWVTNMACLQLKQYFSRERRNFDLPMATHGTCYQQRVWRQLQAIGYGQTCSYSEIAWAIGSPKSCRAVGSANGRNPWPIIIPCHRVIAKNGDLAGYALGRGVKEWLITFESLKKATK